MAGIHPSYEVGEAVMKLRFVLIAAPAALVWVPAALAGPVQEGYGGGGGVQNQVSQGAAGVAGGSLPFTGFDLALLVIGGLMLLVLGMFLRRAAKRST
jgi:hypothetical protein